VKIIPVTVGFNLRMGHSAPATGGPQPCCTTRKPSNAIFIYDRDHVFKMCGWVVLTILLNASKRLSHAEGIAL
jgi:hypothetical protein